MGGVSQHAMGQIPPNRHSLGPGTPQSRHSPEQTPSTADTPPTANTYWSRHTPSVQCMLGDTVNEREVCILLECNLVFSRSVFITITLNYLLVGPIVRDRVSASLYTIVTSIVDFNNVPFKNFLLVGGVTVRKSRKEEGVNLFCLQ